MTRCPRCGSTDLVGGRYFHLTAHVTATLPCRCGAGEDGVAAVRRSRRSALMEEWGAARDDGIWVPEAVEEVDPGDEEDVRTEVHCPGCVIDAGPDDWGVRAIGVVDNRAGQTPFTACGGCGAEYLFD